jgi:nuclear distribution protein NudE
LHSDLDDTKLALDEFQVSSKELETELEKELQATEKQLKELRGKEENLLHEIEQWKVHPISPLSKKDDNSTKTWTDHLSRWPNHPNQIKYHSSLKDHTKTMTHMQTELETCRKSNEEYRTRLRDMELDNDELEGKER